jgi:cellulase/cellobiase CelA1
MIHDAVDVLEATPGVSVYVDGGNAKWVPAPDMAKRLKAAGVEDADGFSLNVSNYVATDETLAYGHAISAALGNKIHFIIDTGPKRQRRHPRRRMVQSEGAGARAPLPRPTRVTRSWTRTSG